MINKSLRNTLRSIVNQVIPFPYNFGLNFVKKYKFLQQSQYWSKDQLKQYQWEKLKNILHHAYQNVPYYQKQWKTLGLHPNDIQCFDHMKQLPILTKADVVKFNKELQVRNVKKYKPIINYTGGSTGTALSLLLSKSMNQWEQAFVWRYFNLGGFFPTDKVLYTRGKILSNLNNQAAPYEINLARTECYISAFHLTEETLKYYFEIICKFRPVIWRTYPSCIQIMTAYAKQNNIKLPSLKAIFTSSETLTQTQREMAEEYWGCKVFDWYGQAERIAGIFSCEQGKYHVNDEYGYSEYLSLKDDQYELIATPFYNLAMPLIRYQTNDIVIKSDNVKLSCDCGRTLPLIERIEGRKDDFIRSEERGNVIRSEERGNVGTAGLALAFKYIEGVIYSQIIQHTLDKICVKLMVNDTFNEEAHQRLEKELRLRLGKKININYEFVDSIERTKAGKLRFVISHLKDIK